MTVCLMSTNQLCLLKVCEYPSQHQQRESAHLVFPAIQLVKVPALLHLFPRWGIPSDQVATNSKFS